MIRIVHILTSFDVGGAEQLVLELCRRLPGDRFSAEVVAVVRGGPLEEEFRAAGIPTLVIGKTTKWGLDTIRRLQAHLETRRPDIVHTHLFGGDTWGRVAALRAGIRCLVSTEHNVNVDEGIVKRCVKRVLARRTARIVAVSDAVRMRSIRWDGIPARLLTVIPNGVDTDQFHPMPGTPHAEFRLLTVGRLVPQKGHDILIDALATMRDQLPRVELDILGDGPCRAALEAQVRAFRLQDRVHFLGIHRDLPQQYPTADCAVFPSRWEGFGIAAVEAMACGIPVLATRVDGLAEVVVHGVTGVLVPSNDPLALAQAIRDLAHDRPRRLLLGAAGRRRAQECFDIRRVVDRYAALYTELCSTYARPARQ
ncbi:glycosyltransferase [Candidatus Uhrbacteria bacterium]|nr:glycosyltransferase [Candidatus Uhrbacteria bacterium]